MKTPTSAPRPESASAASTPATSEPTLPIAPASPAPPAPPTDTVTGVAYVTLAQEMRNGITAHDPLYLEHQRGDIRPDGHKIASASDVVDDVRRRTDLLGQCLETPVALFDSQLWRIAVGSESTPASQAARQLSDQIGELYDLMLSLAVDTWWSSRSQLRSRCTGRWSRCSSDSVIRQSWAGILTCADKIDERGRQLSTGIAPTSQLDLSYHMKVDPAASEHMSRAFDNFTRSLQSG